MLPPDLLFPAAQPTRAIARQLYRHVRDLPIVSPHGHTDARWYADNHPFHDPASLFVIPDHYIFRMLYSQGIALESLGVRRRDGMASETDARKIWQVFASNYHLFRGTPTRVWLDHAFATLFDLDMRLNAANADFYYDRIAEHLSYRNSGRAPSSSASTSKSSRQPKVHARPARRAFQALQSSGWPGRVITAYRPDSIVDPDFEGFPTQSSLIFGRIDWLRHFDLARLPRCPSQTASVFQEHLGATVQRYGHPFCPHLLILPRSRSGGFVRQSRTR